MRRLLSSKGLEVLARQATPGRGEESTPIRQRPRGRSGDVAEGIRAWAEGRAAGALVAVAGPAREREREREEGEEEQPEFLFSRSHSDSLVAVPPNLASD